MATNARCGFILASPHRSRISSPSSETILSMRTVLALILLAATAALAQSTPRTHVSHTTEGLRGVSAVTQKIVWASGTHGTYLRTTDGRIWISDHVPAAES